MKVRDCQHLHWDIPHGCDAPLVELEEIAGRFDLGYDASLGRVPDETDRLRAEVAALRRALELFLDAHGWGNVTACACECCMSARAALARGERSTDAAPDGHSEAPEPRGA